MSLPEDRRHVAGRRLAGKSKARMATAGFRPAPLRRRTERGFSLVEMMTALAIIGVGVTSVLWAISGSLSAQRRVEERAEANDLLRNKLTEYSDYEEPVEETEGRFDPPFEKFRWRVGITPTSHEGLYRLEARVSWEGRGRQRWIDGVTLVPQR